MTNKFSNSLHYFGALCLKFLICLPVLFGTSLAWAARTAVVTSEKAVIWADPQRSAPLGFVRRGKELRVGEKELEKGQVLAVIVSGKVAYISLDDIAIEDQINKAQAEQREATRFKEVVRQKYHQYIVVSGVQYSAAESKNSSAGRPGDSWSFQGGQLKGVAQKEDSHVGLIFMLEYLYGENKIGTQDETIRMFTLGAGPSLALINTRRLILKVEALGLFTPWAQYEAPPLFTLNSYGLGAAGNGSLLFYPWESVGFEASAGIQAIKLLKIDRPDPFDDFSPLFIGAHLSAGVSFRF